MQTTKLKKGQGGFTLVELAIVMIIIGLLIGGILKGQELVANAQVTATVAQIKGLDGAISTFRDKYSTLPGDMATPNVRLRDCVAAPCSTGGDANGRIDGPGLATLPALNQEGLVAFTHMAAADLISGIDINGARVFGGALPEAELGGGFWLGFTNGTAAVAGIAGVRQGQYLVLNALPANIAAGSDTGLQTTQAAQIDRKLDDGVADSGDVRSTGANCEVAGVYQEANVQGNCSMFLRTQG